MREVGLVAPNDVLSVEAQRSRERVLLIDARNAPRRGRRRSPARHGLAPDVTDRDSSRARGAVADVPGYDVPARRGAREADRAPGPANCGSRAWGRRSAAAAGLKPTIAVVGGADYARPNPRIFPRAADWKPSFDVGVNVAWTLWDGGRVKADVAEVDGEPARRRAAPGRVRRGPRLRGAAAPARSRSRPRRDRGRQPTGSAGDRGAARRRPSGSRPAS